MKFGMWFPDNHIFKGSESFVKISAVRAIVDLKRKQISVSTFRISAALWSRGRLNL